MAVRTGPPGVRQRSLGAPEIGSDLPRTSVHPLCDVAPSRADRHVAERRASDGGGGGISPPSAASDIWILGGAPSSQHAHRRPPPLLARLGPSRFAVYLASRAETQAGLLDPRLSHGPASLWSPVQPTLALLREPLYPVRGWALCTRYGLPAYRRASFARTPAAFTQACMCVLGFAGGNSHERADSRSPPTLPERQAAPQAADEPFQGRRACPLASEKS